MKSRVRVLLFCALGICVAEKIFAMQGMVKELSRGCAKNGAKKKQPKHVAFSFSGEHKSLYDIIEQEVQRKHDILKRRDSLGPDPDEFAQVDVSSPESLDQAKERAKQELGAVVESVERLKLSRQNRVIAAWLQTRLVERDKEKWLHLLAQDNAWGLTQKNSDEVKAALEKLEKQELALCYLIWFQLYKQVYARVLFDERLIPGCGNLHKVLLDPEHLKRKVPLLIMAYGSRKKSSPVHTNTGAELEKEKKEDERMLANLRKKKVPAVIVEPPSPTELSDSSSSDTAYPDFYAR